MFDDGCAIALDDQPCCDEAPSNFRCSDHAVGERRFDLCTLFRVNCRQYLSDAARSANLHSVGG